MANPDLIALGTWSAITAISIVVISLVYRRFSRRKQNEPPAH